ADRNRAVANQRMTGSNARWKWTTDYNRRSIAETAMYRQWGYVGAKSRQRWLFYAYDRIRRTVVAHVFGNSGAMSGLNRASAGCFTRMTGSGRRFAHVFEQWGYVGAKSRQRWLFYAYDRLRKTVCARIR
ncbi:IS1 family transposase, partial [Enterobacter asburiae]|nr:IS1 family transposase [Enterobacter asburiae]